MTRVAPPTASRPSVIEGVVVALVASVFAGASYMVLPLIVPGGLGLRGIVSLLALAYATYLLVRSGKRTGRLSIAVLAATLVGTSAIFEPGLATHLAIHAGFIWLVRSLYFHVGLFPALADLALLAIGLVVATWAALHTGSVFMAAWCLFLVQALFCCIPHTLRAKGQMATFARNDNDRFDRAHRRAEAAVRKLSLMP